MTKPYKLHRFHHWIGRRFMRMVILAGIALLQFSCGSAPESEVSQPSAVRPGAADSLGIVTLTDAQYHTVGIRTGQVELRQISGTFKVNGVLDVPPQRKVSISVPMGGFLRETDMLQGMRVKKGQLIAVLENADYVQMQQDYLEAKSRLEYARADYERQQSLFKEHVSAQKTMQQAKSEFETLTARVRALREKMQATGIPVEAVEKGDIRSTIRLYAPLNGFVTVVNGNIGKFIDPADILFEIVDTEHLHAELTVFEGDVPRLKVGQRVRFTLANEQRERTASVYLIGREVGPDRTIRVHCHIDEEDIHLLPGMYLKAVIETGAEQRPALPSGAIVEHLGQHYIFVEEGRDSAAAEAVHRFRMLPVGKGPGDQGYSEVILAEDFDRSSARVVTEGAFTLLTTMMASGEER